MSRRARTARLAIAAGLLCALVALALRRAGAREADAVATVEVRPGRFVREVGAAGTLKAASAAPIVVPTESGRAQKIAFLAPEGTALAKGDLVVEFDPYDARRESADGAADLASARAGIAKTSAEGHRRERSLVLDRDVARDALERARTFELTDPALFSRNQIIESRLDRTLYDEKSAVAGRRLETSVVLSAADGALAEIGARKARNAIANADRGLHALRILAPHDGFLVLQRNWRGESTFVGDSVWPGEKLAEIPDLTRLQARVFVLEADAAGLKAGLPARVAIEGQPGTDFAATVSRVEPLAKPRDQLSPVKYFEATLALERTDPLVMRAGQRVRAVLTLEQADGVIAIPRGALFEKDGQRVVYRRQGSGFSAVPVTVGRNSASRVVVESGLAAGDRVALRDPSARAPAPAGTAQRTESRP